ncbi:MAG: hypothetical protein K1000chlam2_00029 [Chlamydiae bacterium]|nr:hypothetical protein [Chlamydiota bacterium]
MEGVVKEWILQRKASAGDALKIGSPEFFGSPTEKGNGDEYFAVNVMTLGMFNMHISVEK